MGYYDTKKLPIYAYLHGRGAPNYVIADSFFRAAFGGSFLNHQFFVAAAAPQFVERLNDGSANDLHSIIDANGHADQHPALYTPTDDGEGRAIDAPSATRPTLASRVRLEVITRSTPRSRSISPIRRGRRMPAACRRSRRRRGGGIGDRLSAKKIDWAWYSGGWSNANGDIGASSWTNGTGTTCADPNHHLHGGVPELSRRDLPVPPPGSSTTSPPTRPGTKARKDHLKDEAEFIQAAKKGHTLKQVSFIKPVSEENEHPGYTSESEGSQHLRRSDQGDHRRAGRQGHTDHHHL